MDEEARVTIENARGKLNEEIVKLTAIKANLNALCTEVQSMEDAAENAIEHLELAVEAFSDLL